MGEWKMSAVGMWITDKGCTPGKTDELLDV